MAFRNPSPKIKIHGSASSSEVVSVTNMTWPHMPVFQSEGLNGPVAIFWDIENCPVPSDVRPDDVAVNIRMALKVHPSINGAITRFSAYGDFNAFPRRLREGCQRTGVKLVDVPNGRKDAADKAILVDMFLFVLDNHPPSSIVLISGDVDFAPALHILGERGYDVILVIPSRICVSYALCNAGRFVWDWTSIARGEGFVASRAYIPWGSDLSGYLTNYNFGDCPGTQIEDEDIVYKGCSYTSCSISSNSREAAKAAQSFSECNNHNSVLGALFPSSRLESQPFGISEDSTSWVQPGDIQGLKGQLVRLVEISGGSLPLARVPSEYIRSYGRPLYVSEYGVIKLVHLINRMADALILVGKGAKRLLCLRAPRHDKKSENTPMISKENKNSKGVVVGETAEFGIIPNTGSSSDDFSDDESNADARCEFEGFKREMQEVLVCYSCPIPLNKFEALYEQRYKKVIDYRKFGAEGLEELVEKVRDVARLREDHAGKRKFLIASTVSG